MPVYRRTSSDSSRRSSGYAGSSGGKRVDSPTSPAREGKFGLKSMVTLDDMPDLFASLDSKCLISVITLGILGNSFGFFSGEDYHDWGRATFYCI